MKKGLSYPAIFILFIVLSVNINSQVITGKLVDENGTGLAEVQLQLYTPMNVYEATSGSDGAFLFNIISGIEDNQLPTGYSVSNNYPNPFNPKTRISITLPNRENVKVEVFNLLGQSVTDVIEETFNAGTNSIDIELNGLPNGFYISRINIGDKYTVVKKLMLIYGSQHLTRSGGGINSQLDKFNQFYLETILDSLVATSSIIGRKTFTNLPNFVSGTLDLGNLLIARYCPETPTVTYEGKIYNTLQIGSQCWLKENLDIGISVDGVQDQSDNGIIEKYCYDDNPTNCSTYGGLYQWNEAMQYVTNEAAQGICPQGWHLPTFAEFQALITTVGGDGNALKEVGQGTGGGAGTNTSGFSALLAGYRYSGGTFLSLGYDALFWSSTEDDAADAIYLGLYGSEGFISLGYGSKVYGFSVRCLED